MADEEVPKKKMRRKATKIDVRAAVRDWLVTDDAVTAFSKKRDESKSLLKGLVMETGDPDEKGNLWISFEDDPVEGRIEGLKLERRVSRRLEQDRTEKFLREKNLWDACSTTIVVLDEEKVLAEAYKGAISEDELTTLYDVIESFAFVPQRVRK